MDDPSNLASTGKGCPVPTPVLHFGEATTLQRLPNPASLVNLDPTLFPISRRSSLLTLASCPIPWSRVRALPPVTSTLLVLPLLFPPGAYFLPPMCVVSHSSFSVGHTRGAGRGRGQQESSGLQGITVLTGSKHSLCFICPPTLTSLTAGQRHRKT